ncbi:MAG: DNA-processing protein DprA [Pseudomonadota bacterium]
MAKSDDTDQSSITSQLTEAQQIDWLQLYRTPRVGANTLQQLVNTYGSAAEALSAIDQGARFGGRAIELIPREAAHAELSAARDAGALFVTPGDAGYPPWLVHAHDRPPFLFALGDALLATRPIVAIVGSRDASAAGRSIANRIARELGEAGWVVASGLARGIDAAAHEASLKTGTIAVVAGGLGTVYPPEHDGLQQAIGARGLVLSEMPLTHAPRARDFPRRNRIVSGVAAGVIVIEAARRSGTLVTARLAGEQGREVFAVPGHPLDPRAEGTNALLQQGATLVTSARDVIEALTPVLEVGPERASMAAHLAGRGMRDAGVGDVLVPPEEIGADDSDGSEPARPTPSGLSTASQPTSATTSADPGVARQTVRSLLGTGPVDVDTLCRASGLATPAVRSALIELALDGVIDRHGDQQVSLRPEAPYDVG